MAIEIPFDTSKRTILLIDFLNRFYRGANVNINLKYRGEKTGGIYGVLSQIVNTVNVVNPDTVVVCSDCPPYFRGVEFPDYKKNRRINEDMDKQKDFMRQRTICKELIKLMGLPMLEVKGLEADDLIALLCYRHYKEYKNVVIDSTDSDLNQLVGIKNLHLYRGSKKGFYNRKDFFKEFPNLTKSVEYIDAMAFVGGHNDLPGIKGIGIKTATRIVTDTEYAKTKAHLFKGFEKQTALNKKLHKLPYYKLSRSKADSIKIPDVGQYNRNKLIRFLSKYGIELSKSAMEALAKIH